MTLLAAGPQPILKLGSTGPSVRDLQRTLNAATAGHRRGGQRDLRRRDPRTR